jgi:hypothetical protein
MELAAAVPDAVPGPEGLRYPCISGGEQQILKSVRDACKLQPNTLSIKLGDQIEQLYETFAEIAQQKKVSLAWVVRDASERYVAESVEASRPGKG